ncbi:hypothetical protein [Bosea sp. AK1]|uniref:hypothetical protein n=1 Tax=Bosea sp. AK1 TaxID=2587160 RepID=UPI001150DADD|nr:hypothetical protein [Bosea sp. AK1]
MLRMWKCLYAAKALPSCCQNGGRWLAFLLKPRLAGRNATGGVVKVPPVDCRRKVLLPAISRVPLRQQKAGRRAVLLSNRSASVWVRTAIVIALAIIFALPMAITL